MIQRILRSGGWSSATGCCGGLGHEGGTSMPPGQVLDRSEGGYSYRAIDQAGIEELVHTYEHYDTWTLPDGSRASRERYVCRQSGLTYLQYAGQEATNVVDRQILPDDTLMVTPVPTAGCSDKLLIWIRDLLMQGVPGGAALLGTATMGRRYNPPREEMGRIINSYEEVPIVEPAPEEIEWIFLVTRDLALVSKICKMNERAAVIVEPSAGWLLPDQIPGGSLADADSSGGSGKMLLYGGIAVAAIVGGYIIMKGK